MMNFLTIVLAIIVAYIIMGVAGFALCTSPKFINWLTKRYFKIFERSIEEFEKNEELE